MLRDTDQGLRMLGAWLDSMILKVFSNKSGPLILWFSWQAIFSCPKSCVFPEGCCWFPASQVSSHTDVLPASKFLSVYSEAPSGALFTRHSLLCCLRMFSTWVRPETLLGKCVMGVNIAQMLCDGCLWGGNSSSLGWWKQSPSLGHYCGLALWELHTLHTHQCGSLHWTLWLVTWKSRAMVSSLVLSLSFFWSEGLVELPCRYPQCL